MNASTFRTPIVGLDGDDNVVETILLNRSKVVDWYDNSDDETLFYYKVSDDKTILLKSQYPILQFETIFNENPSNKFIVLNVTAIGTRAITHRSIGPTSTPTFTKLRITIEEIVWARAMPDGYIYLWFRRGNNNYVVVKTTDTLAEIDGTVSDSGSLP